MDFFKLAPSIGSMDETTRAYLILIANGLMWQMKKAKELDDIVAYRKCLSSLIEVLVVLAMGIDAPVSNQVAETIQTINAAQEL